MQNKTSSRKIKLLPKLIHFIFNLKMRTAALLDGKVVGARALIVKNKQVLLIQHTYNNLGWQTVGGGVNAGETAKEAVCREVEEEAGVKVEGNPKLFGVYHSNYYKRDDHIVFYIVDNCSDINHKPSPEIAARQWFKLDELPQDISPATKRRIDEYLGLKPISEKW